MSNAHESGSRSTGSAAAGSRDEVPGGIAAVRGAVSVDANTAEEILAATTGLLVALCESNGITRERIVSAVFTATDDLDADYPAHAARRLGWTDVPLLGAREISVPGALPRVIRVLLTVTGVPHGVRLAPLYLGEAAALRPDLAPGSRVASTERAAGPRGAHPRAARASGAARPHVERIAIIGLGQIGGSIGLALATDDGWHRVGYDVDVGAARAARAAGAVDEVAGTQEAACAGAALVVVATPADTIPATLDRVAAGMPRGATLVDTCSARAFATPALARAAARGLACAGFHPLAGNEGRGFAAARADLFRGATIVVSPSGGVEPPIVARLAGDLGGRLRRAAPEVHDHALARTSHLPYLVACALRGLGEEAARSGLSGPAFRDMTRLAASDERMALGYCRANAAEVRAAWTALRAALDARMDALGEPADPPGAS